MNKDSVRQPFWSMTIEETFHALEAKIGGLSNEEAKKRLIVFGSNEIKDGHNFSKTRLFFGQFASPLIIILIIAGIVTILVKDRVGSLVIFSAVILNSLLGFYQENKAENVLEILKSYIKTRARVRRPTGELIEDASFLVPGDIVRISQGDKIPADGRIIFSNNFEVAESVLTGESFPAEKTTEPVEASASVGDRASMLFESTLAVSGFADAIVTATGL